MPKHVVRHEVAQPQDQSYKLIPLTRGQNAIVDSADYDWLNQWEWFAFKSKKTFYVMRYVPIRNHIMMHIAIVGEKGWDHANGNGLDNRRSNLRKATASQQQYNRRLQSNSTSGYKGVSWHKNLGCWRTRIHVDRKEIHIGIFDDIKDAARAYNEAAIKYHGEFASLNQV